MPPTAKQCGSPILAVCVSFLGDPFVHARQSTELSAPTVGGIRKTTDSTTPKLGVLLSASQHRLQSEALKLRRNCKVITSTAWTALGLEGEYLNP
jgi:hypothetical protein